MWNDRGVCMTCGQRVHESQLTPVILSILCGGTGLVLFRNPRGFDKRTKAKYGLTDGAADYIGFYSPDGRFVAVEIKTPRGRQEPDQIAFEALITRGNCVYAIVRSPDDAHELLRKLGGGALEDHTQTT